MIERVYISELQSDLHYKDRRSARRWCKNQNIRILHDIGSNKQFILRDEYESAKCGNYYPSQENIKISENYFNLYNIGIEKKEPEYQPRFENEGRMLSILRNI